MSKEKVFADGFSFKTRENQPYEGSDKIQYAKTPMNYHEVNTVVKSVKYLSEWLKSKGVEFEIISDRNPAHESVKRGEL